MAINSMPLVSVVVTTYNRRELLMKTIDSILNQTYKNFELIVVDNYSDYDFLSYLKSFKDERIRSFQNKNEGIIAVNRNFGIKKAKGEYIAFCDDDDTWYPEKLMVCHNFFNSKADLIYHDLRVVGDKRIFSRKLLKGRNHESPVLIDLLINGNPICNSSVIVRKSIIESIGGIDEKKEMVTVEDYNTWLKIAETTNRFVYISKVLGEYLHQNDSMSQKQVNRMNSLKTSTKDFVHYLDVNKTKKYLAWESYFNGRFLFLVGEFEKAKDALLDSLRYGIMEIKIKSLWMIISCLIRLNIARQ